jgi:4-hydroxy-4-methyl-2-oxoglutarate aldolase
VKGGDAGKESQEMATISKDLVEKFKKMDTTSVSDALDRLGIKGGCQGILPQVSGIKMVGTAFTVRYRPCGTGKGTVGDFLDDTRFWIL